MLFNASHLIWRALTVLPCLIDDGSRQQLRWIEVADSKPFEPRFLPTRQAVQLRPTNIPQLDIDSVGAALAEEEHGHWTSLATQRTKGKTSQKSVPLRVLGSMMKIGMSQGAATPRQRPRRSVATVALVTAMAGAGYWLSEERSERWTDLATPRGKLRVLIASEAADRSRGLSRRDDIPGDGLLLEWDASGRHPIWMMDMRFPLDLIWLEEHGRVVHVLTNVPACRGSTCPLHEPNGTHESIAVLELAAGAAARHGIEVGTVIGGLASSFNTR